jgi:5-methylcytosine-specific restriction endonuclease McrA
MKKAYKYWRNIRKQILERDNNTCSVCGTDIGTMHVHHIIERCTGGTDDESNLMTLCSLCHHKHHNPEPETGIMCLKINFESQELEDLFSKYDIKISITAGVTQQRTD